MGGVTRSSWQVVPQSRLSQLSSTSPCSCAEPIRHNSTSQLPERRCRSTCRGQGPERPEDLSSVGEGVVLRVDLFIDALWQQALEFVLVHRDLVGSIGHPHDWQLVHQVVFILKEGGDLRAVS